MFNKKMLRQAKELQARLAKAQEEMEKATVEASSGGGAVKVVMSGGQRLLEVKISPEAVNPQDVELLQDLVLTAVNEALKKAQELSLKSLGDLGPLGLP